MYFYMYNNVIHNIYNIKHIADLKIMITNKYNKWYVDNIKISYDFENKTFVPNDNEKLFHYIIYTVSIIPIKCEKHMCN